MPLIFLSFFALVISLTTSYKPGTSISSLLLKVERGLSTSCSLKPWLRLRTSTDFASTRGFSFEARPAIQPTNRKNRISVKIISANNEARNILKKLFIMKLFEEVKNRNLESGIGIRLRVLSKSFNATMIIFEFCNQLNYGR